MELFAIIGLEIGELVVGFLGNLTSTGNSKNLRREVSDCKILSDQKEVVLGE